MLLQCALLLVIAQSLLVASPTGEVTRADFDEAQQKIARLVEASKWQEAKALLLGTLTLHAERDYVREQLPAIQDTLKRCAFGSANPPPGAKDVFAGEVRAYDQRTGLIELGYSQPEHKQGAAKPAKDAPPAEAAFPGPDFESIDGESVLNVPFVGPFVIDLEGRAMDQINPTVRIGIGQAATYTVKYDFGNSSTVTRTSGQASFVVSSSSTLANVTGPYKITINVRDAQIDATHNTKRIVDAVKDKDLFGRVGYAQFANLQKIRVAGVADRAWIQARIDALVQQEMAAFEKTYDANAQLPEWLRPK